MLTGLGRSGLGVAERPTDAPVATESPPTEDATLAELAAPGDRDMLNDNGELRNLFAVDTCVWCSDVDAVIISRSQINRCTLVALSSNKLKQTKSNH